MERKATSGYASSFVKDGAVAVEEIAIVELTETDTEFLLVLPSLVSASDVREVNIIDEKNARYEAVIASHKNPDAFVPKPMQSINNPTKNQNEMTAANPLREVGSQATSYDILDDTVTVTTGIADTDTTIAEGTTTDITELGDDAGVTKIVKKFVCDTLSVALTSNGALLDTTSVAKPDALLDGRVVSDAKGKDAKKSRVRTAATTNDSGTGSGTAIGDGSHTQAAASQQQNSVSDGLSGGASGYNMHGGVSTTGGETGDGGYIEQDSIQILRDKQAQHILSSKALLKKLELVERAVQQNAYHKEHLDYRNLPEIVSSSKAGDRAHHDGEQLFGGFGSNVNVAPVAVVAVDEEVEEDPETEEAAGVAAVDAAAEAAAHRKEPVHNGVNSNFVRKLFSWANIDLVRGRAVTAMAANTANNDIVAVGYGKLDTVPNPDAEDENGSSYGGLVLFWSLRNPDYPEKILRTPHPVTALNFSKLSPTLIAVGLYSGELMIYDVKRESDWGTPIESSQNMTGGHSDPIWDLKWLLKTNERVETIVSISTDGNVLQWSLKKGLVVSTLMQLKRGGVVCIHVYICIYISVCPIYMCPHMSVCIYIYIDYPNIILLYLLLFISYT